MRTTPRLCLLCLALLALSCLGCARFTKAGADCEVYGLLDDGRGCVPEVVGTLRVDAADDIADARREKRAYSLTLDAALELAAAASREYRREREDVYLAALDLTLAQNDFSPSYGLGTTGELLTDSLVPPGGTRVRGDVRGDVSSAFESGGGFVLALATDFLKHLTTGNPFHIAQTLLSADIFMPLARGAGWVARENLTQAERDTLYALRDYARFQQEFTVEVASAFYRLLRLRDTWQNEEMTFTSLQRLLERQVALGAQAAGRIPDFEVDQTRQDVLRTDERRLLANVAFLSALDAFKLRLGVPVDVEIEIPDTDLEALRQRGPLGLPMGRGAGVMLALDRRLDLQNARDQEADAWRRVLVAKNALGAQVDLRLGAALRTASTRPFELDDAQIDGLFGLDIDLPLERTAERNRYRAALIQAARARRNRQGFEDGVVLEVRDAFRSLDRAQRSYVIQLDGVRLAERRVESTTILLEAQKASTRDRLDAEDALVRARNALTVALIDHVISRLELERDLGTLMVGADAVWTETPEATDDPDVPPAGTAPDPYASTPGTTDPTCPVPFPPP